MAGDEDYAAKFAEALVAEEGATPDSGATESGEETDAAAESGAEKSGAGDEGQRADKADPWASVRAKYTPESIAELERRAEEAENAKAMRREAHLRNETAARDKADAEELRRMANEALQRNQTISETLAHFAETNPELGLQMLQTLRRSALAEGGAETAAVGRRSGEDPRVAKLEAELDSLRKQTMDFAFGSNTRALEDIAWSIVQKDPLLSKSSIASIGIPEQVVRRAIEAVYERDRSAPADEKINPHDRRAMTKAVEEAVKAERGSVQKMYDTFVKDYRTDKRAAHAKLPPSGTGSTASARGGAPTTDRAPTNLRGKARDEWYISQMAEASKPRMRSEV